jgi:hypothetical protein
MAGMAMQELEADVACAAESFPWVTGVYALDSTTTARSHPDAFAFAVVLSPYDLRHLAQTHYALVVGVGGQAPEQVTGRVLYVDGTTRMPTPMHRARRIVLSAAAREDARRRGLARKEEHGRRESEGEGHVVRLAEIELAFRRLAEQAANDGPPETSGPPYRDRANAPFRGRAVAAAFSGAVLEIVPDPFPSTPRRRILVGDTQPESEAALAALGDSYDVVYVHDGWSAVDLLSTGTFDLAICSVVLGEIPAVKIYRMVTKAKPEMAGRFVFLASKSAMPDSLPPSARGRVVTRPLEPDTVRKLLENEPK